MGEGPSFTVMNVGTSWAKASRGQGKETVPDGRTSPILARESSGQGGREPRVAPATIRRGQYDAFRSIDHPDLSNSEMHAPETQSLSH